MACYGVTCGPDRFFLVYESLGEIFSPVSLKEPSRESIFLDLEPHYSFPRSRGSGERCRLSVELRLPGKQPSS